MTRREILGSAEKNICGGRECDYGKPENNFEEIAKLWSDWKDIKFTAYDVAVMMALMKIARMKSGTKPDSVVDGVGYLAIAGELDDRDKNDKWKINPDEIVRIINSNSKEEDHKYDTLKNLKKENKALIKEYNEAIKKQNKSSDLAKECTEYKEPALNSFFNDVSDVVVGKPV